MVGKVRRYFKENNYAHQAGRQAGRNQRHFQPSLHGSLESGSLESRLLTAPLFTRSGAFNATLLAGSDSYALDQSNNLAFGTGSGIDNLYQTGVVAATDATGNFDDGMGNTLYSSTESSNVKATVSGPGTGDPNDPNPDSSAQIQINVKHSGTDTFRNNTANPINPKVLLSNMSEDSKTTSGGQGGNSLAYVTGGGVNGMSTVTVTFQATISATGANGQFIVGASLTLNSTYLSVTVSQAKGLVATDSNGNVVLNDPNFEKTLPYNGAGNATVTVPNVPDNTNLGISYSSSLNTSVGQAPGVVGGPPPGNANFAPGVTTDDASFNWSLTYKIS